MRLSVKKLALVVGVAVVGSAMAIGTSVAANAASVGFVHVIEHRADSTATPFDFPTAWPTGAPTAWPTSTPTPGPTDPGTHWMKCTIKRLPHVIPTGAPTTAPVPTPMPVITANPSDPSHRHHHHHHHFVWCLRPHFHPGVVHGQGPGHAVNPGQPGEPYAPGTHKFQPGPVGVNGHGGDSSGNSGSGK